MCPDRDHRMDADFKNSALHPVLQGATLPDWLAVVVAQNFTFRTLPAFSKIKISH